MIKKALSILISLCIVLTTSYIAFSVENVGIPITVTSKQARRGDSINISVNIGGGSNMQACGFSVQYDPAVLELKSAKKGSVLPSAPIINTNVSGKIMVSYAATSPVLSAGSLLDLSFQITERAPYGESLLSLSVTEFADGSFTSIDHYQKDGIVTVIAPALDAPSNVTVLKTESSKIQLLWDSIEDATGYNLYVNDERVNAEPIEENIYIIEGLEPDAEYSIQVSTLNYATESSKSRALVVRTNKPACEVLFVDWYYDPDFFDPELFLEGCIFKAETVEFGQAATPPDDPVREGHIFNGWDQDYSCIVSDTVIRATYIPLQYDVSFIDWNGVIISKQSVSYGQAAVLPDEPHRDGYTFVGWDKSTDDVKTEMSVYAVYEEIPCQHESTVIVNMVESTCNDNGYSGDVQCTVCGRIISTGSLLPFGEHKYTLTVTEPTPTTQGYTTHVCTVCGDSFVDNYTDYVTEDAPLIFASSAKSTTGKSVTIELSVKNNPGFTAMRVFVDYDPNVLTLINSESTDLLAGMSPSFSPTYEERPYQMQWSSGTKNATGNGIFATLTFSVKENAEAGEYPIVISYAEDDIFNTNFDNVKFYIQNGKVEIISYVPGDVNGNGIVNLKDVALLQQYLSNWDVVIVEAASDPNGDGKINLKDVALLQQYLSGWDVVLK